MSPLPGALITRPGDAGHADAAQAAAIAIAEVTARNPMNVSCDLSGDPPVKPTGRVSAKPQLSTIAAKSSKPDHPMGGESLLATRPPLPGRRNREAFAWVLPDRKS